VHFIFGNSVLWEFKIDLKPGKAACKTGFVTFTLKAGFTSSTTHRVRRQQES
jgi:hypothetical protein